LSNNPYESPEKAGEPLARKTGTLGGCLVQFAVVVSVVAILIALLLPARRSATGAARRSQCTNNLKQIGLALHNYVSVKHAFPPAYTVDENGKPLHSWRTLILPYLEQQTLYDKIDLSKPWDDPANKEAYETVVDAYQCPSVDIPATHTTYLAVVARGGCFEPDEPLGLSDITDGTSSALMVLEVDAGNSTHWMSPTDADQQLILNREAIPPPHRGGSQALCADGSVHFLPSELNPAVLRARISIDGNDDAVVKDAF